MFCGTPVIVSARTRGAQAQIVPPSLAGVPKPGGIAHARGAGTVADVDCASII